MTALRPLVLLLSVIVIVLALICAGCSRRSDGSSTYQPAPNPADGEHYEQDKRPRESAPVTTPSPSAGHQFSKILKGDDVGGVTATDRAQQDTKAAPVATPGIIGDLRAGAENEAPKPSRKADHSPVLARDLGDGANGEKLGDPRRRPDDDRPLPGELPALRENPFVRADAPGGDASTFAADVDSASYNVVRSCLLEQHRVPQPAEVRVEELINRFAYSYPTPTADDAHPFRVSTEVVACPWRRDHQIVRIGIAGETLARRQRPPASLVFLIDVSGSMSPENRLPLLKRSLGYLVDQLNEQDQVAIVAYAGEAGIVLDPTTGDQHRAIKRAIDRLGAGGSTHGSAGIQEAYRLARQMQRRGGETRVILATDGDFNVGTTNGDELVRLVRHEAEANVYLTALGFGMGGGGDARLQQLADQGNGFHAFIDRPDEAKRLFIERLPSSLVTIAQDVKIQVFFNPSAVAAWRLIGYENRQLRREDFNDDRIDAGEIGAGHTMTALYEIVPAVAGVNANDPNPFIANDEPQRAAPAPFAGDTLLRVRLRYQPPGGGASRLLEQDVRGRDWRRTPSADTSFAMGIAAFGMLLRDSPDRRETGSCTWNLASELVRAGGDSDERQEVQELIAAARRSDR
jgi:Ca-activated chloride channel homolog